MTHGEKMALLGKINMLYELAIEISNKINKLNKQLEEAEKDNGSSKTSNNRSRRFRCRLFA